MDVNDFDVLWPCICPDKAEPELVVDALQAIAWWDFLERLQAIAWWNLSIVEAGGRIEDGELAEDELTEVELAEGSASEASKAAGQGEGDHELTWRPVLPVFLSLPVPPSVTPQPGCPHAPGPFEDLRATIAERMRMRPIELLPEASRYERCGASELQQILGENR